MSETKPTDQRLTQLGKELKKAREDLELGIDEVAQRSGISTVRLTHIEDGMDPSMSEIFRLAETYGFTPQGLLDRTLPPPGG